MNAETISADDPYPRQRVAVLDSEIAYIDTGVGAGAGAGAGRPVVFLHGNPTSSYLWRNIIPPVAGTAGGADGTGGARCLAPDLVGMGQSGKAAGGDYSFAAHARYLDAWFAALGLDRDVVLVVHDWGSALGFHWAHRHADAVAGLVYMEALVRPVTWDDWPEGARRVFQGMRSDAGEEMVLEKNIFVERILPASVLRGLSEAEMAVYRAPYLEAGESRRPTLTWPRQIPIDGEPEDVVRVVADYGAWLKDCPIPKLFVNAEPGSILTGAQREFCRTWANQREITVPGSHFIQEDSPQQIGAAVADFVTGLDA